MTDQTRNSLVQDVTTFPFYGELGTLNLNNLTGSDYGIYRQSESGNVYSGLNYPVDSPGSLLVLQSRGEGCTQEYRPYDSNVLYRRRYALGTFMWSWSSWCQEYSSENPPPVAAEAGVPAGAVILWGAAMPPAGWLVCDGSAFNPADFPALALVYPGGQVPDLSGPAALGLWYITKAIG